MKPFRKMVTPSLGGRVKIHMELENNFVCDVRQTGLPTSEGVEKWLPKRFPKRKCQSFKIQDQNTKSTLCSDYWMAAW